MSCLISSGIADSCRGSVGGISTVYLGNFPTGITADSDWLTISTGSTVEAFLSGEVWEYKPNMDSSQFVENYEASIENGAFGFNQVLTLVFSNMTAAKQNQIKLMAAGELFAIVKDRNGSFWLIGSQRGAYLTGGSADTGKVLGDGNKYSLEITANQGDEAYQVDAAAVALILQP